MKPAQEIIATGEEFVSGKGGIKYPQTLRFVERLLAAMKCEALWNMVCR
jgi:hypothetical protein